MVRLFASNTVFVLILVPILFIGNLLLHTYFPAIDMTSNHITDLWGISFEGLSTIVSNSILIVLLTTNALLINYIYNKHDFFERNTYLPSLIYVLIVCFFPMSIALNGDIIAHFFIILALHELLDIKQSDDARKIAFNAGLFIGLGTTMNPIFIYVLPVFSLALLTIRTFVFREHLLVILGFIIPFLWLYYVNANFHLALFDFKAELNYNGLSYYLLIVPHVIVILLLLFAYRAIGLRLTKSSIRFKRLMTMILYLLVLTILSILFVFSVFQSYFYFAAGAVVLPFIVSYAYSDTKHKIIPTILIYLIIALQIIKHLG